MFEGNSSRSVASSMYGCFAIKLCKFVNKGDVDEHSRLGECLHI